MEFSIIIPHYNSVDLLPKLLSTIPSSNEIEILVIDNSPVKISKESVKSDKNFKLLYSDPSRGAGGARNVGIEQACGKWLIFADADDYFTEEAFSVFNSFKDSEADLIYTCMGGIYLDTGEPSDRGDYFTNTVRGYLSGDIPETDLRLKLPSPCCKMVKHDLIQKYSLRYDEVVASNDMFFSMLCGYYAKTIAASDRITYIATVVKGSLTRRRDYPVISSRFRVYLRYNQFLKSHGYGEYQRSVLYFALTLCKFGFSSTIETIKLLIKYHQNPLIGCKNWISTMKRKKIRDQKEKAYIVK